MERQDKQSASVGNANVNIQQTQQQAVFYGIDRSVQSWFNPPPVQPSQQQFYDRIQQEIVEAYVRLAQPTWIVPAPASAPPVQVWQCHACGGWSGRGEQLCSSCKFDPSWRAKVAGRTGRGAPSASPPPRLCAICNAITPPPTAKVCAACEMGAVAKKTALVPVISGGVGTLPLDNCYALDDRIPVSRPALGATAGSSWWPASVEAE